MTDEWDRQEGGNHYKNMAIQPSEFFEANGFGWLAASAMKYLCRYDKKGTPDLDLAKAAHYVSLLQQVQAAKSEAAFAEAQRDKLEELQANTEERWSQQDVKVTKKEVKAFKKQWEAILQKSVTGSALEAVPGRAEQRVNHLYPDSLGDPDDCADPRHVHPSEKELEAKRSAHEQNYRAPDEPLAAWEKELLHGVAWTTGDPEPGPEVQYVRAANSQVFKRVTIQRWRSNPHKSLLGDDATVPKGEYYDVTMWRAGMGVEIAWPDLLARVPLPLIDCTNEFGAQADG